MTPVQVLNKLIQVDKQVALPILAGLAVVAAAAIVATWGIDFQSAVLVGIYIVALGAFLYVVAHLLTSVDDPIIKRIFGWFFIIFIMLVMTVFFLSAAFPGVTSIASTPCLVRFWEHCAKVGDQIAERNFTPVKPPEVQPPTPTSAVQPSEYQVLVQFAGIIRREDVKDMMTKLRAAGWKVQGIERGGERTVAAAGVNEIRYTLPGDESAARALARAVQSANLTSKTINPVRVQTPPIAAKTLEVWISR